MATVPPSACPAQDAGAASQPWIRVVLAPPRSADEIEQDRIEAALRLLTRRSAREAIRQRSRTFRAQIPQRGRHRAPVTGWNLASRALASWPDTLRALVLVSVPLLLIGGVVVLVQLTTPAAGIPVGVSAAGLTAWQLLRRRPPRWASL
ncbi:hypothetical protein ABZ639_09495 [Saccharomonospora sp. NPDC006951]